MTEFENMIRNFIQTHINEISCLSSKGIHNKDGKLIFPCKDCDIRFNDIIEELNKVHEESKDSETKPVRKRKYTKKK